MLGEGPGEEMYIGDIGRAGHLLVQEWEEAARKRESAWERGRDEDVSPAHFDALFSLGCCIIFLYHITYIISL